MTVEPSQNSDRNGLRSAFAQRADRRFLVLGAAVLASLLAPLSAQAMRDRVQPGFVDDGNVPKQVEGVEIDDRAGAQLPKDVHFLDQNGRAVALGDYLDGQRPVVLVLAYYTCPMICTTVLNGIAQGLKDVAWVAGDTYRIVTVSIDPRDTPATAARKRADLLGVYGRQVKTDAWDFLTGDEANVKRLADAIGFHYRWDPEQQQYAHAAGAFILTPTGKVSRVLYGIGFAPNDLKLALVEASQGRFTTAVDRLLLFCFHYDPKAGKYVLAAQRLMTASGAVTALALGFWIFRFWRNEPKRTSA